MASQRLASLDALRGLTIIGMIFVNAAATVHYGLNKAVFGPLLHASWSGLTLADLVFPAFVFIMGLSIVYSLSDVKKSVGLTRATFKKITVRSLKIILIGMILSNIYYMSHFEVSFFRPFGVLQRIGITFFAAALLYMLLGPRGLLAIACALLLGYIGILFIPYPDGVVDLSTKGANFVSWFDRAIAGGHTYVRGPLGYDPEGIISTLPTIGQALLGVLTAIWLKKNQETPASAIKPLIIIGVALIVLGLILSPIVPIIKDVWSTTFVCVTTGISLVIFSVFYYLLDYKKKNMVGKNALISFGVNSIFAYVVHYLTSTVMTWSISAVCVQTAINIGLDVKIAALIPVILFILAHWYMLDIMRRKNWIVKI